LRLKNKFFSKKRRLDHLKLATIESLETALAERWLEKLLEETKHLVNSCMRNCAFLLPQKVYKKSGLDSKEIQVSLLPAMKFRVMD